MKNFDREMDVLDWVMVGGALFFGFMFGMLTAQFMLT
jgi:hypothetical protein